MSWLDLIRNNFWLKAFSLGLAVLIYGAVDSAIKPDSDGLTLNILKVTQDKDFTERVLLLVSPESGQGYKITPESVTITVSGESDAINQLTPSMFQIYARLDAAKGPTMADFRVEVMLPRNITLKSVIPDTVSIETISGNFMVVPFAPIKQ